MNDEEFLQNRISLVEKYLSLLSKYSEVDKELLLQDDQLRGAVERYLYLAIQSTIDLAETVISKKRLRKAQSLSESFEILAENDVIPRELAENLVKMVGFRNILSHGYHKIDYEIVCSVLHEGLKDIERFLDTLR